MHDESEIQENLSREVQMTSVRAAKAKGSCFEYDCQASLEQAFKNVIRTAERGYQRQYDLEIRESGSEKIVAIIECKRLKGVSWNQLEGFWSKLSQKVTINPGSKGYLLFQSNHQPCLVFAYYGGKPCIQRFEDVFGVPFIKHKSTRSF